MLPEPLMHSITLVVLSRKAVGFKNASIPHHFFLSLAVNQVRLWWKANLVIFRTFRRTPGDTCLVASGTLKAATWFFPP